MRTLTSILLVFALQQTVVRVDVQLRQVVVTVRDEHDRLVNNLKEEDFIVEDNGVQQRIANLIQDNETPISLGVLIDTSPSMLDMPAATISALSAAVGVTRVLMKLMKPTDEFLLMSFDDSFAIEQAFTQDRDKIETALRKLYVGNTSNLFPAVSLGLEEVRKSRYKKRALVVITDAFVTGDFKSLQRSIRDSEILIYTFAIRGSGPAGNLTRMPSTADDRRVLETLAGESGGQSQIFDLNSNQLINRMVEFVQELAAELRGQYTIGYYPQTKGSSTNHSIRVRMAFSKHHVRVRRDMVTP